MIQSTHHLDRKNNLEFGNHPDKTCLDELFFEVKILLRFRTNHNQDQKLKLFQSEHDIKDHRPQGGKLF